MREGSAWIRLRKLLDVAQDTSLVSFAFDAHAASTGQLRELAARGSETLRELVAVEVRNTGDTFVDPSDLAWTATRDDHLAHMFAALGLDARLRRHSRPLTERAKADVVRVIVGEVQRVDGVKRARSEEAFWRRDLLTGLAGAALQLYAERGPRRPRSAGATFSRADAKLSSLLQSGSARAIVGRLRAMLKGPQGPLGIRSAIARTLPKLVENIMRLSVFMQVLQVLCTPTGPVRGTKADAEQVALVGSVAQGVLASDIPFLPFESPEQIAAVEQSPYLSHELTQAILELMHPAGACVIEHGYPPGAEIALDMYGNPCLVGPGGQNYASSSPASSLQGLQAPTLKLDPHLVGASSPVPSLYDPRPADMPMRPPPLLSPGACGALRTVSPSHSSLSPRMPRPISPGVGSLSEANLLMSERRVTPERRISADGIVDERPQRPYDELRPWVPVDELARLSDLPLTQSQRLLAQNHYLPWSASSVQAQHDDIMLAHLASGMPGPPNVGYPSRPSHDEMRAVMLAGASNVGSHPVTPKARYMPSPSQRFSPMPTPGTRRSPSPRGRPLSPRSRYARELAQDSIDEHMLHRMCAEEHSPQFGAHGPMSVPFARPSSPASRISKAAEKFRRLAASMERVPPGVDLDRRTERLLSAGSIRSTA